MDNCEKDNLSHFIKTTAEFFNLGQHISPCFSGMRLHGEKTDAQNLPMIKQFVSQPPKLFCTNSTDHCRLECDPKNGFLNDRLVFLHLHDCRTF